MSVFNNKTILITGGTGSFGKKFTEIVLKKHRPKKLIVYSRDEMKQYEMQRQFRGYKSIRFFIGDVRDKSRLLMALHGVDFVLHTAALKQVGAMEYNPAEAVKTNIFGAMNIIDAAIERKVKRVIAISTDKACNPINLYGASKLCSDKLFVAGNSYSGKARTRFSVVRYGNVLWSRGSVAPLFKDKIKDGVIPVTDINMTRFVITLEQAINFVTKCFSVMRGGELFVPKIPSVRVVDLAKAIAPRCRIKKVGIRPGEKLHEIMISEDDARHTLEFKDYYFVKPRFPWWRRELSYSGSKEVPKDFRYASNNNKEWLEGKKLKKALGLK